MKKKIKAFIEIGKNLDYDISSDPDGVSFMLLGQGDTIEAAKEDFWDCLEDMKSTFTKAGREFPDVEFEFVYDIPSFLKYSPFPLTWLSNATGINKHQLSHYTTQKRNPSKVTLAKIQTAYQRFVEDFRQVQFV